MDSMFDGLTTLIRVISQDDRMRQWFKSLERKSERERAVEIHSMVVRMAGVKEAQGFVKSLKLLMVPQVFAAASHGLKRC
jgi:hypothetical protein